MENTAKFELFYGVAWKDAVAGQGARTPTGVDLCTNN